MIAKMLERVMQDELHSQRSSMDSHIPGRQEQDLKKRERLDYWMNVWVLKRLQIQQYSFHLIVDRFLMIYSNRILIF